jgi:biotin carboxyl carrier protein
MKYFARVNGEEHEIELAEKLGRLVVKYDGEPVDVRYDEVDRLGQLALYVGDRAFGASIEGDSEQSLVTVAGHVYTVELEDERERAAHAAERGRTKAGGDVKSVMPGVVVDLLVAEGDVVEAGQPLLILEAMKMQNEIEAPRAGRVVKLFVAKGEAVGTGVRLVTLGAATDDEEQSAS